MHGLLTFCFIFYSTHGLLNTALLEFGWLLEFSSISDKKCKTSINYLTLKTIIGKKMDTGQFQLIMETLVIFSSQDIQEQLLYVPTNSG